MSNIALHHLGAAGTSTPRAKGVIVHGDNLPYLRSLPSASVDMIYIDPPFNTGRMQERKQLRTIRDDLRPDRKGFKGNGYRTEILGSHSFGDSFDDFAGFIVPRLEAAHRLLTAGGSLFLHIDYREVHYCKIYLDQIFGRPSFINEIIWAYDYGARSKRRWSAKHDNILWYAKDPENYVFNYEDIDRIPYMAPGLVGPEKAARGKTPTDTWWHTIVSPTGKEKTGYPTQKPLGIIERIVRLHSRPGDTVMDFFAGSGTVGEACAKLGRNYVLVDSSAAAIEVMTKRLSQYAPEIVSQTKAPAAMPKTPPKPGADVHIIAAGVWNYDHLAALRGPKKDLEAVSDLFQAPEIGLFSKAQIQILENPTVEMLRKAFVDYAMARSAKGDVLVFYFSGHGTSMGNNEFGFCLKDTQVRPDGGGCVPLSVLRFDDIVRTLTAADVHPIFIIDACFSGKAGQEQMKILGAMQDDMHRTAASSYGLLCACYAEVLAHDTEEGGAFTRALCEVASSGLDDKLHKAKPLLELADLSGPVQQRLMKDGFPLSKLYLGPDLPSFALVRNAAYQARTESLMGYHGDILRYLWNDGDPREVSLTQILKSLGQSAYGNHSKLSLAPWRLVEDGKNSKHRRLTERGKQFLLGKLRLPEMIERNLQTGEWEAGKGRIVGIDDVKRSETKKKRKTAS